MSLFSELSNEVGWEKRNIQYPSIGEVRVALERHNRHDLFQLILWNRNLKNPETPKQVKTIRLIEDGLANMKV
jgi:hypothetical protein